MGTGGKLFAFARSLARLNEKYSIRAILRAIDKSIFYPVRELCHVRLKLKQLRHQKLAIRDKCSYIYPSIFIDLALLVKRIL